MELMGRDMEIVRCVFRFRFTLGRHIRELAGFSSSRSADRRLRTLIMGGYLERKKYLYGLPYLYTLTHKGRMLIGANKRKDKIRLDRIAHDIFLLDTVIYFIKKHNISLDDIESEKELHIKDGFSGRKHHPDFVFSLNNKNNKKYAVEVELNPKTKSNLEKNIRSNYMNYDRQIWITNDKKVFAMLSSFKEVYSNLEIIDLGEILDYVK